MHPTCPLTAAGALDLRPTRVHAAATAKRNCHTGAPAAAPSQLAEETARAANSATSCSVSLRGKCPCRRRSCSTPWAATKLSL